jgi:NAD(P)-dependent dehydrogenase (short-subunit alcohol dehydrogenase family)
MDLQLTGKVALVTGGSRGIGKAIAWELAREGADVAIAARDQATLDETAAELARETGRHILPLTVDTGDDESVRQLVAAVMTARGRIDILVNCAARPGGQSTPPRLAEITADMFWDDMNVKVLGYLRCAREVAPHMISQGWGRIVNISGLAARQTGSTIGSLRNVAVVALTKNLANELGPHGINVTVVHPGTTRTEKTAGVVAAQAQALGITPAEAEQRLAAGNVLHRLIDAQEIAYVVAFLASPKAVAVNGDVIAAGGGVGQGIYY